MISPYRLIRDTMAVSEETSSMQVLGTVTADAVVTVSLAFFSFDGSMIDALVPPGLPAQSSLAAMMCDVLAMIILRGTLSVACVAGVKTFTSPCGLLMVGAFHVLMVVWMGTKAVFAAKAVNDGLDITITNSHATIHVWWLYVTLVMSGVFGWIEHNLCIAWAAIFRGERLIELGPLSYGDRNRDSQWYQAFYVRDQPSTAVEPLLDSLQHDSRANASAPAAIL